MYDELENPGERISKLSDEELLEIVNTHVADYRSETIDSAKEELLERGFKLIRTGADFEVITPIGIKLMPPNTISQLPESHNQEDIGEHALQLSSVNSAPVDYRYKGVGGWLMFFIVTLVFLGPGSMLSGLGQYDLVWGRFYATYPSLEVIKTIYQVIGLGLICFSVYAGISLWKVRPYAVRIAKNYLIFYAFASITLACLPLFAGLPEQANSAILQALPTEIIKGLVYPMTWYLYLRKSKRVAATYSFVV